MDVSLNTSTERPGCGITITQNYYIILERGVRLHDWATTTQSELFAIFMGMKEVENKRLDSVILSDSQSALKSINSHNPNHSCLVKEIRFRHKKILKKGLKVKLLWVPSHIGFQMHDRVDELAKAATEYDNIDYDLGLSLNKIRYILRTKSRDNLEVERHSQISNSYSVTHHESMYKTKHNYGSTRLVDVITARLRLGYKSFSELGHYRRESETDCKLCGEREGNTLNHYVLECHLIQEYRDNHIDELPNMCNHFITTGKIKAILDKYPHFAEP